MRSIAFLGWGSWEPDGRARLLAAGFDVTVWNRTPGPADALRAQGAAVARSPAEAARGADVVITMLGDPASVKDVALGPGGSWRRSIPGRCTST
jgi:3-hydroxyisobutyrate dehydrogenase-like beta-hydroxyacid dehydrogenase